MPDVVQLRERDDASRRIDRDREIVRSVVRTGDRVAGLVQDDLTALAVAVAVDQHVRVIERIKARVHVGAGKAQRIGHAACTVGSIVHAAAGDEVQREVDGR